MLTFETITTFVGPKEDIDKLASVNWNLVSSAEYADGDPTHYFKATRESNSSLIIEGVCEQTICG